ncbi:hypothetical protein ABK040_011547 [Willaertia magna]
MEIIPLDIKLNEIQNYGTIECSCFDNLLHLFFLGTSEGYLFCFQILKNLNDNYQINLLFKDRPKKNNTSIWGKTTVKTILVDEQCNVLFIQAGNTIEFFKYELLTASNTLQLKYIKKIHENINSFTIDNCKQNHRLLVCQKKKLIIYHYNEHDCLAINDGLDEFILKENISEMSHFILYDKSLALGFKKGYELLDLENLNNQNNYTPILDLIGNQKPFLYDMDDEVILRQDNICVFVNLITKSLTELRGSPSQRPLINFSAVPLQLAISFPYLVGLLDQGKKIEVYNMSDANLVKTLAIIEKLVNNNKTITTSIVTTTSTNLNNSINNNNNNENINFEHVTNFKILQSTIDLGILIICDKNKQTTNTEQCIYLLRSIPVEKQILSLFEDNHCLEAFELFEKNLQFKKEKGEFIQNEKEIRQILLQQASFNNLINLEMERAFTYFREHETFESIGFDIRELLYLFSDFRQLIVTNIELSNNNTLQSFKNNFELIYKTYLQNENNVMKSNFGKKYFGKVLHVIFLEKLSQKRNIIDKNELENLIDKEILNAKRQLLNLLEIRKNKLLNILKNYKNDKLFIDSTMESYLTGLITIDNCLFKLFLDFKEYDKLELFLKDKYNLCNLDICYNTLITSKDLNYKNNVINYYYSLLLKTKFNLNLKNLIKSFDLLKKNGLEGNMQNISEKSILEAINMLIYLFNNVNQTSNVTNTIQTFQLDNYLNKTFTFEELKEIFWKNLEWCFKLNPFESIQIINYNYSYFGIEPILKFIRQHLDENTQNEVIQYFLEYIIHERNNETSSLTVDNNKLRIMIDIPNQYYTLLALKYIDGIIKYELQNNYEFISELRTKFILHLQICKDKISVGTILNRLQGTNLYLEIILCYSFLGDHERALRIFLYNLYSPESAENYCLQQLLQKEEELNMENNVDDIFVILLKLCFESKNYIDFGITILNKYPKYINALEILKVLPKNISVSKILPFLIVNLKQTTNNFRNNKIIANISKVDHFQTSCELMQYHQRKKVITSKTKCVYCGKLMLDTMLVIYPDLQVFHFGCFNKEMNVNRVTKRNFIKEPFIVNNSDGTTYPIVKK